MKCLLSVSILFSFFYFLEHMIYFDVKTKEQVAQFKTKTRISNTVLSAEVLTIQNVKNSILSSFEDALCTNVSLTYCFNRMT